MKRLVLLTDTDDSTMLVECPDHATAEKVGRAAIYSDGGVSAWIIPVTPYVDGSHIGTLIQALRSGSSIGYVKDLLRPDSNPDPLSQTYEDYLSDEPGQHGLPDGLSRETYESVVLLHELPLEVRIGYHRVSDDSVSSGVWVPGFRRDEYVRNLLDADDIDNAWWRRLDIPGNETHPIKGDGGS